ncbi:EscU/YscU/HrcU family type III secretion system export apparatus switch protein [Planomonospora sp. ID91781]|uniref:Type III secretion exporter n=1 Tax=Planomonospora sphaerica TaxID=161355 RepID=A0A171DQ33_9ACTN|nr:MULTISPECIES: EscU/YscU/HrcU family type III secretion system export apparatus switch protein [Planomonospora]MBG0826063.1 EscU/YscU/HrcU family type III secretion system export apparatus switch protein [Planomonospora sp. ID91781]GAT71165.1 type III secretion exporter [Planomonospora sphaerica]
MSGGGGGEKTEQPTAKKKQDAQKEGQIARTPDFAAWASMLAAGVLMPMVLEDSVEAAEGVMLRVGEVIENPDPALGLQILISGLGDAMLAVAPIAAATVVITLAAAAAQGGLKPATKLFKPQFKKLNPLQGLKRMFGGQALWESAKALMKTATLTGIAYMAIRDLIPILLASGSLPLGVLLSSAGDAILSLMRFAGATGLALAAADYAMARRRIGKQLRMTKQEVKEEYKRSEGDPHVKGQIRARQQAMARNRMMADVPTADVVLVNPTHVAVALRYDPAKGAPRVVAKGSGTIAAKIREIAAENRIPMVQDVPLARALHKSCDIGQEIPAEMYGAIAKVLAFVMTLKAKGSAAGTHRLAA